MSDLVKIPMFPLAIFPLPGELVPLHIFEPRYKQLLEDAEQKDISFGIYFNHSANTEKLGSLVKLESVIKHYPGGESDIIVKCTDLFYMDTLHRTYKDRLYPGGDVNLWNIKLPQTLTDKLKSEFESFRSLMNLKNYSGDLSLFTIANELSLDFADRLKFVLLNSEKKESFLLARLQYQKQLLQQVEKAKDVFHLN
ncbi:MAG TPA: LON peptidase substrate-binding domain-containing protein [Cyclobacteriaceae bacterium]